MMARRLSTGSVCTDARGGASDLRTVFQLDFIVALPWSERHAPTGSAQARRSLDSQLHEVATDVPDCAIRVG